MDIDRQTNAASSGHLAQEIQSALACERCKRRKIKCDRGLPACEKCHKNARGCCYPLTSNKPGPKPGAPQKRKRRPQRLPSSAIQARPELSESPPSAVGNSIPSVDSPPPCYSQPMDHQNQYGKPDTGIPTPRSSQSGPSHRVTSPDSRTGTPRSRGLAFSLLLHPSHDPFPATSAGVEDGDADEETMLRKISEVCHEFQISYETYEVLLHAYFENMTAFSLFHRPTFDKKLNNISSPLQLRALLASMFSFSARFRSNADYSQHHSIPSPDYFQKTSERLVNDALRECLDETPPLCLLQAMILTTFPQLITGVRGQAWRSVGNCVRIAYELQLHLIDKNHQSNESESNKSRDEEARRAWWVIWELDVFASTIRRLPTAIDWTNNETWLPNDDEVWFANGYTKSCHLNPDAAIAWKDLDKSGNKSAKSWFIVVNAMMRCAHFLSYPQAYSTNPTRSQDPDEDPGPIGLGILASALYCLTAALPSSLAYQGEFLNFSVSRTGLQSSIHQDSAKHCIHIMIQLCRFMVNHYQVFSSTPRRIGMSKSAKGNQSSASLDLLDKAAWTIYVSAASEIVTLVRNSSPKHIQYVNPFLASTIWLAAAAQIVSRSSDTLVDPRATNSNLDLLQMNLNTYVNFWGVSGSLQQKLSTLEAKLSTSKDQGGAASTRRELSEQPQDPQITTSGVSQAHIRQNFGCDEPTQYMQVAPTEIAGHIPMGFNGGLATNSWSAQQSFDMGTSAMGSEMDAGLWGWGLDELLAYGGLD